jgi:hypothetical protein
MAADRRDQGKGSEELDLDPKKMKKKMIEIRSFPPLSGHW